MNAKFGVDPNGPNYAVRQKALGQLPDAFYNELGENPHFAGVFIDNDAGTVIVVQATGDLSYFTGVVEKYGGPDRLFDVRSVMYSDAELETIKERIVADFEEWKASGVELSQIGIDPTTNRVAIVVVELSDAQSALLVERYGPAVSVASGERIVPEHCTSNAHCADTASHSGGSTMQGGLEINSPAGRCSSGFRAKDAGINGGYYLLTAGHCISGAGIGATWTHTPQTVRSEPD